MADRAKIQGIFTPHMVPLDAQGNIHEPELRRYIDWLIERGVHGLYPNGSTGEFTRLTPDERRQIVEIVVDQTAGRVPILAGAAEANVRETLAACEHYHRLGVRAVAIVSPYYYRLSPDNVYAYFKRIADNTPVDVTLYNIPMFASPIDVPTIRRLSRECPRIVGIKDSSGDAAEMMRMIEAVRPDRPDFSFLTGWDTVLAPMLSIGCDGGTNASSGVAPELTRRLYDLMTSGPATGRDAKPPLRWRDEAGRIQAKITTLFDAAVGAADFPEGFRTAVSLRGFRMGTGRQPLSEKHRARLKQLEQTLRTWFDDEGLTGIPSEGRGRCPFESASAPTPSGAISPQQISRIVEQVLAELQQRGAI